jgi:hypothetical protein
MAKELGIRIGEQEGILTLYDDKAPVACSVIIEHLPLKSHAIIAKVAGLELMMRVPFFLDTYPEYLVEPQEAGNVCLWDFSQNICIFCEDLPALGPGNLVGKITGNLEGIRQEAIKCRDEEQGAEMELYEVTR